jgi:hypothetical protein
MFTPRIPRTKLAQGYITEAEYEELAEVAERYGLTISSAVQQCIVAGLEAEREASGIQPSNGKLRTLNGDSKVDLRGARARASTGRP